jgi:hypothetical protein
VIGDGDEQRHAGALADAGQHPDQHPDQASDQGGHHVGLSPRGTLVHSAVRDDDGGEEAKHLDLIRDRRLQKQARQRHGLRELESWAEKDKRRDNGHEQAEQHGAPDLRPADPAERGRRQFREALRARPVNGTYGNHASLRAGLAD